MKSNHNLHLIIAGLIIVILLSVMYYNHRINKIQQVFSQEQFQSIQELTPVVENIRDSMVITLDAIKKTEEQITILKIEMKDLKVDTIGIDEAIKLIKDKRNETNHNNMFINY